MFSVQSVKLFVSLLYRDEPVRAEAKELMARRWGAIDYESESVPFFENEAILEEMGRPLFRSFLSFSNLIDPGEIALIKMTCLGLEQRLQHQNKRRVNLDPGYLDAYKVVFTSTQAGPQKIYHSSGIYLDLQLMFVKNKFQKLPWSYPEIKSQQFDSDFSSMMQLYQTALSSLPPKT